MHMDPSFSSLNMHLVLFYNAHFVEIIQPPDTTNVYSEIFPKAHSLSWNTLRVLHAF